MENEQSFEDAAPAQVGDGDLVLDLEGYEGPIDMLLALARQQKVDLTRISILQLAEQFLTFINEARRLRLEIAADYLVMAAWLAYLKSRLLLPVPDDNEDELSAPELAESLRFQLRRLESMQQAGASIMALPRLGRDTFSRGSPEGVKFVRTPVYELSLYDLLKAYGDQRRRKDTSTLHIQASELYSMRDAMENLRGIIGDFVDWERLLDYLPAGVGDAERLVVRSAISATFAASLELVREGELELRQSNAFGPIFVRRAQKKAVVQ